MDVSDSNDRGSAVRVHASSPEAVEYLHDHRHWRPDWTPGRSLLWWYLTFEHQPALESLTAETAPVLGALDSIDQVPLQWLHLTLQEVGYADEFSATDSTTLVAEAAGAVGDVSPLRLSLGPISTLPDGVVLRAGPTRELSMLRDKLRDVTAAVTGGSPRVREGAESCPHVTLAYVNCQCERRAVMDILASLAMDAPAEVLVETVTLAAVTRRSGFYDWHAVGEVALGGAPTA